MMSRSRQLFASPFVRSARSSVLSQLFRAAEPAGNLRHLLNGSLLLCVAQAASLSDSVWMGSREYKVP
jgi:hypothetical protein